MRQHYAIMQHLTHFPTIICTFFINCHEPTTNTTFAKIYSGCKYTFKLYHNLDPLHYIEGTGRTDNNNI